MKVNIKYINKQGIKSQTTKDYSSISEIYTKAAQAGCVIESITEILENNLEGIFWKVRLAYDDATQDVSIGVEDLPKVCWAFRKKIDVVIKDSAFRGKDIISILPDYNRIMGYNDDYKPTSTEWGDIKRNKKLGEGQTYFSMITNLAHEAVDYKSFMEKSNQLLLN